MDENILFFGNCDTVCRFCLVSHENMQTFSVIQLSTHQITKLYRTLMDFEMITTPDYSFSFCDSCIKELEAAAQIREHLKTIEQFWKKFLNNSESPSLQIKQEESNNIQSLHVQVSETETEDTKPVLSNFIINEILPSSAANTSTFTQIMIKRSEENAQLEDENIISCVKNKKKFVGHCNECGSEFTNRTELLKHIRSHIDRTCYICDVSFSTVQSWFSHQKRHIYNKSKKPLRKFKKRPQKIYKFFCKHCDRKFEFLHSLFIHQRICHRQQMKIVCYRCDQEFDRKYALYIHLIYKHDSRSPEGWFCHICGVFIKWKNSQRHMKLTHANGKIGRMFRLPDSALQSTKCSYCSETFKVKARLHRHVEAMHPDNLKEHCKQHNLYVSNKQKYIRKIIVHPKVYCNVCGMKFDDRLQLNEHLPIHKNYECEICKKGFIGKQNLDIHLKQHSKKDRPFVCQICSATFTQNTHLKGHIRRKHSTDRPHACDKCDKSFAYGFELISHTNIVHLKLKPYKCSYCDKTFSTGQGKRIHETMHTGNKCFKCQLCPKECRSMKAMETHIGRYHNK